MLRTTSVRRWFLLALALATSPAFADTTVTFAFHWSDYAAGSDHPLQLANVVFYDFLNGPAGTPFAGPITTDANGQLSLVTSYANVDSQNNIEIQPGIVATINGVGSAYLDNAAPNPYIFFPAGYYPATRDQTSSFTPSWNNTTDAAKMLEALQIIAFMKNYYAAPAYIANLPAIRLNYNSANAASSMGAGIMNLGYSDWANVDVLLHEYAHHVAEFNGLQAATIGNTHSMNKDNISANNAGRNYGPLAGAKVAWQEGLATYLEQVAIIDGHLSNTIPSLPDATNMAYDVFTPPTGAAIINPTTDFAWNVAINTLNIQLASPGNPLFPSRGKGEGDEMSVMRTLWDFQNNLNVENYARAGQADYSNYGGPRIFNLAKGIPIANANQGTLYAFWQAITADVRTNKPLVALTPADPDAQAVMRLGMTLEQNGISGIPLSFGFQATDKPTVTWSEQNNLNSAQFSVLIFSEDWTTLVASSPNIAAGVDTWTSTTSLAAGAYEYVILNSSALATDAELDASNYNWYWSGNATISVPEPASLMLWTFGAGLLLRRRRRQAC